MNIPGRFELKITRLFVMGILSGALAVSVGCSTTTVRSTDHVALEQKAQPVQNLQPENDFVDGNEPIYLDVGVLVFDPGLDEDYDNEDVVLPEIRIAESNYHAQHLVSTLQRSGHWGAVRVLPNDAIQVEVFVDGKILQSDGETLEFAITVYDATGRQWFKKEYDEVTSRLAYDKEQLRRADPFDGMYNLIANDMAAYLQKLDERDFAEVRTVSELRFANDFSPEAFSQYLVEKKDGKYEYDRLPASNDPTVERIRFIRERDYLFVDTLQEYYDIFSRDMEPSYNEWRKASYDEVMELRNLKRRSRNEMLAGVVGIVGGIAGIAMGDSAAARTAGAVAAGSGSYLIKRGLETRDQMSSSIEILQELGESLQYEVEERVIELDDRTVRLSGSVEEQYDRWRSVLQEMYKLEYGDGDSSSEPDVALN